jgi:hypothetical protein
MIRPNNGQDDPYDGENFFLGVACAILLSIPLWVLILWIVLKVAA